MSPTAARCFAWEVEIDLHYVSRLDIIGDLATSGLEHWKKQSLHIVLTYLYMSLLTLHFSSQKKEFIVLKSFISLHHLGRPCKPSQRSGSVLPHEPLCAEWDWLLFTSEQQGDATSQLHLEVAGAIGGCENSFVALFVIFFYFWNDSGVNPAWC